MTKDKKARVFVRWGEASLELFSFIFLNETVSSFSSLIHLVGVRFYLSIAMNKVSQLFRLSNTWPKWLWHEVLL